MGGGSGGHVTPVVAVLRELAKKDEKLEALFVCDKAFEQQSRGLMATLPFPVDVRTITAGKLRRYAHFSWWHYLQNFNIVLRNVADIVRIAGGFFQSLGLLLRFRPDVVFAKGGYVCLPMGIAARLLRIPLVIHDSDTRPGLTNRVLARFATSIATGAPLQNYSYDAAKSHYVGVPINPAIHPVSSAEQIEYKQKLDVSADTQLVVAVGGGLGSRTINDAIIETARTTGDGVFFYNITGKANYDIALKHAEGVKSYRAVPFVYENLNEVLGAADIVVTRASATTLQELAGLQKAVIAVPAKQLGDQLKNATVFAEAEAAIVIQDDELAEKLAPAITGLLENRAHSDQLAEKLHTFARPDAASDVAGLVYRARRRA